MKLVNMTPHEISIINADGGIISIPPSGEVVRVAMVSTCVATIEGINFCATQFGCVEGLPEQVEGTMLIVSGMVLDASERGDLCAPGNLVRDRDGRPVACDGLRIRGGVK